MRVVSPLLLLLALVGSACGAPVAPGAPPLGSGLVPVEAQRLIDHASATAGAVATQNAFGAATERSAVSTSTAAARATWDALAVGQTQIALDSARTAQAGAATDSAAQRTQAAAATAAWATPTAAAMQTQAARELADYQRRAAAATATAEFWRSLRAVTLGVVAMLGVVMCVLLWVGGLTRIRLAEIAARAEAARAGFRLLPPANWAEWTPGEGYQVYELPGRLDPQGAFGSEPPALIERDSVESQPSRLHAWRLNLRVFAWAGERFGFSHGVLAGAYSPHRIMTEPAWRLFTRLLRGAGVLSGGNEGTRWAEGWDYARFADELVHGPLSLPYPDADPPMVGLGQVPHTATPHQTRHTATPLRVRPGG